MFRIIASLFIPCAALLFNAGCTTSGTLTQETAIARAVAEPTGIETTVSLTVRRVGDMFENSGGYVLGSAPEDTKSEGILVLVTSRAAAEQAAAGITDPTAAFLGKEILVNGIVRRMEIEDADEDGLRNGQVHTITGIVIYSAGQIALADSGIRPKSLPAIDIGRAKTADFLAASPNNPILALYIEALQKRINQLLAEEFFKARFGSGYTLVPGRSVRVRVTVLADGRIAADIDEIRSQLRKDPELANVMLSVFMRITADPVPMPPALRESGQRMIQYEAQFGIE